MPSKTTTTEAKKSRTQRVVFVGEADDNVLAAFGSATFKLPGGSEVSLTFDSIAMASLAHALRYGFRRLFQDGLAGAIQDGEDADEAAEALIEKMRTGDWSRSRSGRGITMQSVAATLYKIAFKNKHGKMPDAETTKAGVTKLLDSEGNPTGYAKVKERFDALVAADGIEID